MDIVVEHDRLLAIVVCFVYKLVRKMIKKENTILLTGDTGMLGQAIKRIMSENGYKVYGVSRSSPDFCINLEHYDEVVECVNDFKPRIIINTAAIIDIARCERDPREAYLINSKLPGVLAKLCNEIGAYFIQISTDHYYGGDKDKKHNESDKISIYNEYAQTKYLGECLALLYDSSLVIRTNIIGFRERGMDTFLEWILNSIQKKDQLTLFDDFYTSSMSCVDFSRILVDVIRKHIVGLINIASSEVTSKKEFVLRLSEALYGYLPEYKVGSVHDSGLTDRGDSLGLDVSKIESILGYSMPDLDKTIQSIKEEYKLRKRE